MARLSRAEIFDPSEIVAVHTMARTNRRSLLVGRGSIHWKELRPPKAVDRRKT